ncbi:conserved hypothetical protein [Ricinus communis]|uniref:Uncharacterized protein n=1 Tax=Ricinus communis TaxID=3988 RepID=B9RL83_RICCO|nr:conserved hypothetical protein [Ricinus communis]
MPSRLVCQYRGLQRIRPTLLEFKLRSDFARFLDQVRCTWSSQAILHNLPESGDPIVDDAYRAWVVCADIILSLY